MDSYLILDIHLIELIDAAHSVISEHEGTGLDAEISCLWVL